MASACAVLGSANLEFDGGGERNALQAAKALKDVGYSVTIFGSGSAYDRNPLVRLDGINYVKNAFAFDIFSSKAALKITNNASLGLIGLFDFRRIMNIVSGYDVYYFVTPGIMFSKLVAKQKCKRVILANHGTFFEILLSSKRPYSKALERLLRFLIFRRVPRDIKVQAQNKFQENYYRKLGFKNIYLIPQNDVKFDDYGIRESSGFNVVFLNKLTRNKGSGLLFKILKEAPDKMFFHIMGHGSENHSEALSRNNVKFYGHVDEERKREILSRSDAMINCSAYESLSISSIEGLASGLHIIAPPISGLMFLKSLVPEGVTIVNREAGEFIRALKNLYEKKANDPDSYYLKRKSIREKARAFLDKEAVELKLKEMISDPWRS